jgi:LytR cell envelope-related transcriptional attenuator
MVLLALSLSLSDQVQKYGSYVGIAAFFGLAILSLLYFAQAREVKRLREWAGRAPERAREVEEAALAAADAARLRPPPVAVPQAAPQPVAAATAAGGRSGTVSPAVPVGTAVAEQERPDGEAPEDEADEAPVVEGPVTADGKRPVAAKAPEVAAAADEGDDEPDGEGDDDLRDEAADADTDGDEAADAQPAPAATSPSNGAPPAGAEPPMIPRPSTAAGVAGASGAAAASAGSGPAPGAAKRPAPAMPLRSAPPTASPRRAVTQPPRRPLPPPAPASSGHGGRRWAIAGGVLAVIAALGIYAATQLLNDDTPTTPNQAATPTASATQSATASGGGQNSTSRGSTTVAVFNGTTTAGLASSTADKLAGSGYKRGSTGDFTDQQRATSTIFYRAAARRHARDIGRELKISDLRPMDAETQALAGEGADVAVVVGSDKAP